MQDKVENLYFCNVVRLVLFKLFLIFLLIKIEFLKIEEDNERELWSKV